MDAAATGRRPAAAGFQRGRAEPAAGCVVRSEGIQTRTLRAAPPARGIRKGDAMTLLENWVHSRYASALGWTLVHSLWEGALVALLVGAALLLLRSSRARYIAGCSAMLALLIGFFLTF